MDFERLGHTYGTPLYVYDGDQMANNYRLFVDSFQVKHLKVHYACKALNNISVLRLFQKLGAGLDCVSLNEVILGLQAGFLPSDIIYTPNNVSEDEYDEAIRRGVLINVDNLPMLEHIGHEYPGQPLCIRINPHIMAGGHEHISVGHIDSKFGISIHQFPLVKRIIKRLHIPVEGLHIHTGSDIVDPEVYMRGVEVILGLATELPDLKYIDFGSGFKVKYKSDGFETDIRVLGELFSKKFNAFCQEEGKELTLRFEPGKFLVSNAGYFLAKVNLVKQTTACTFAGLNTGFNHLIRPMFYDAWHEIENVSNPDGNKKIYTVVGYVCETDTFGVDRILPEVRKDDLLVFRNAGAYCYSMSSNYNMRERPAEVLVLKEKDYLISRRETYEDLVRNQLDPLVEM